MDGLNLFLTTISYRPNIQPRSAALFLSLNLTLVNGRLAPFHETFHNTVSPHRLRTLNSAELTSFWPQAA